ncbi:helix-turn-helix domain-containing protein [Streptomyces sp. NPDC055709]
MQVGEDYVREVIHAFNERGFDEPDPKRSGGRPKTINDEVREHICLIARTSPADWKITAFATWSLSKLAEHLVKQKGSRRHQPEDPAQDPARGQSLLEDHGRALTPDSVHRRDLDLDGPGERSPRGDEALTRQVQGGRVRVVPVEAGSDDQVGRH